MCICVILTDVFVYLCYIDQCICAIVLDLEINLLSIPDCKFTPSCAIGDLVQLMTIAD